MKKLPLFIGHRGFRVNVDENTFNSFEHATKLKMDYIELDIHRTLDNRLVIMHDNSLNRTTTGSGIISELTWEQISNVRSVPGNFTIPLLDEVILRFAPKYQIDQNKQSNIDTSEQFPRLMIEVKDNKSDKTAKLVSLACQKIQEIANLDRVIISSRSIADLYTVHLLLPQIRLCLNIASCSDFSTKKLLKTTKREDLPLPFYQISQRSTKITKRFVDKCHEFGIQALVWDFVPLEKSITRIRKYIGWNIDGILFDSPELVTKIREIVTK